jgi:ubiquinone/menaquinone biosynthesis C-methylase UbiE
MKTTAVSKYLLDNYSNYYEDGNNPEGDALWRKIGAIPKVDNILALCNQYPHRSIIEIGAGEGSVLQELSARNFAEELYAIDISKSGIKKIQERQIETLRECQTYDGYTIPYANEQFDIAILTHVVEHLENPRMLIYEASRVAKYLFVEVPLEHTVSLPTDFVFDQVGHINSYTPKTIRRLLQSCDLEVIEQKVTNHSKAVHLHPEGKSSLAKYHIKNLCLQLIPTVAVNLFTYNSALICQKANLNSSKI